MAVTLTSSGITFSDGTSHTTAPSQRAQRTSITSTSTDRSLGGDSGWVTHLSISFTPAITGPVQMWAFCSPTFESGAVDGRARFVIDSTAYNDNSPTIAYQFNINRATGSHKLWGFAGNISASAHTAYFQVRNVAGGTTWIMNYFTGSDYFGIVYY